MLFRSNRKKNIERSELNWKDIFDCLNKIKSELKEYFPYRIIEIEHAEADDVIAVLSHTYSRREKILIMSGDKDFQQLQRFSNVFQYDPVRKKQIVNSDPITFLKEHIIRGDPGDGIPNILSADNSFVVGERQKPISAKKLETWMGMPPENFCNEYTLRNYKRNEQLIDLTMTPSDIREKIITSFEEQEGKTAKDIMNYFIDNRLRSLVENIGDFL